MVPIKALASGVGSLITTFLSGNWVAVLVHPITLTAIAIVALTGWAYSKGIDHERRAQARAILDLNARLERWQTAYQQVDKQAEIRLQAALENWRKTSGQRVVSAAQCKIDKSTAVTLADIAGD
jgi:Tfp pilus assembly protein PilE